MSRTKRKDRYIETTGIPLWGSVIDATRDCKKGYKPGKAFKSAQRQKDSNKPKQALRAAIVQGKDLDGIVLPDAKKHDVWDYN